MENLIHLPLQMRRAEIAAQTFNEDANTVDLTFTTGATVRRFSFRDGPYDEELMVEPGAVRLERLNSGAPFLNTHYSLDLNAVIGSVVPGSARIDNGRGVATVQLSRAISSADIVRNIKDGVIRNVSVGYNVHRVEKIEGEDGDIIPRWRVTDWEPMELSAVPIPADSGARIRSNETLFDFHPCVMTVRSCATPPVDNGQVKESTMDVAANNSTPAVVSVGGTPAVHTLESIHHDDQGQLVHTRAGEPVRQPENIDQEAIRREVTDTERSRASTISDLATRSNQHALGDEHVRDGTSVDVFRGVLLEKLFKEQQENAPIGTSSIQVGPGPSESDRRATAIESSLLHRFDPARFELSEHGLQFRGMTLLELGRECLEAQGTRTRGMSKMDISGAMLTRTGGLMSTSDFPGILANVANKTLRQGYEAAPQTFRPLVREVTVPDFKQVSRNQLGEAPMLEKVNEHGEFHRGSMGEGVEKYAIATYGKVVGITRQVLVNDDLNAFTRIPFSFGVQAANLESNIVWAQILANAAMGDGVALFHATHANLGTAAAITTASVGAGRTLMNKQVGLDGVTLINVTPSYLIVPAALQTVAEQFVGAIFPATNTTTVPESLRRLQVIAEPRLDNGVTVDGVTYAGSSSNWYLAGSTAQIDIIELAYLEGSPGVYTETRMGFDVDGFEIKVRMDVGAKAIDWRGLFKNPN